MKLWQLFLADDIRFDTMANAESPAMVCHVKLYACLILAMLQVGCGEQRRATPESGPIFKARGNEPGWAVDVGHEQITLLADYGNIRVVARTTEPKIDGDTTTYETDADGRSLTITIVNRICADGMSGLPYPKTVTVHFNNEELRGCGGDSKDLLVGPEWVVEQINGSAVPNELRGTIHFYDDGSISGRSFCNSFSGAYTIGELLSISLATTTLMGCAPEVMAQEKLLTDLLPQLRRLEVPENGILIIHTDDGRNIRLHRP